MLAVAAISIEHEPFGYCHDETVVFPAHQHRHNEAFTLIRGSCQIPLSISQKLAVRQCDGDPKPKIDPELPDFVNAYIKDTRR